MFGLGLRLPKGGVSPIEILLDRPDDGTGVRLDLG
jgi:hypothetical protein